VPRHAGAKMLVLDDGTIFGTIGGGKIELQVIQDALKIKHPTSIHYDLTKDLKMSCGGNLDIFFEPVMNRKKLFVFGAGHTGNALVNLATQFDFDITVIDDRTNFIEQIEGNHAKKICAAYRDAFQQLHFDEETFICILTYSHAVDHEILAHCIHQPHQYLGMMGSLRKVLMTKQKFIEAGLATEAQLNQVDMPMGIDIDAEGPEEIAISILAKIISVKNKTNTK
jgi:xanthine dehydrogenase accessory factor